MKTFVLAVAVSVVGLAAGWAADPEFQPGGGLDEKSLREFVAATMADYRVPGAAVAVVKDGKAFFVEGFGVLEEGGGAKVDGETIFQLASVSKTFAAAATAAVVGEGKIGWNQPVSEVLAGFEMATPYATEWMHSRDLLAHRAGFEGFFGDLFDHLGYSRSDVLGRIRYVEPGYSFRDHPEYSNLGFFVAGEAAAKANGSTFEELVAEKVTGPLGMTRTGRASELLGGDDANVSGHHQILDGEVVVIPKANLSDVFVAAGGLASSAADLSRYLEMLLAEGEFEGREVLTADNVAELFEPVIADAPGFAEFPPIGAGSGFDYSPGWGIYHYAGRRIVEKGGALDGIRTVLVVVPEAGLGIAVLANLNLTAFPEAVRAGILQRALGQPGEASLQPAIRRQADGIQEMLMAPEEAPTDPKPIPRPLEDYVGTYTNDLYGTWRIELNSGPDPGEVPLIVLAGAAGYRGTVVPWDGDEMRVSWPIVINVPTEIKFGDGRFTYRGYVFVRSGETAGIVGGDVE